MTTKDWVKEIEHKNYSTLKDMINKADLAELHKLEKKITAFYNHGNIDEKQLAKLDVLIMERVAEIECKD